MRIAQLTRHLGMIIAFGMLASVTALAGPAHGGRGGKHGFKIQKMVERLNLTADQQARIKALQEQFKTANAGTIQEMKTLRERMKEQARAQDRTGMQATRQQIEAKKEQLAAARDRMMEQVRQILTAEQRAELDKMLAEKKARGKGMKGEKNGTRKGQPAPGARIN